MRSEEKANVISRILRHFGVGMALMLSAWAVLGADGGRVPRPAIVIEKPGQCVEPADVMRRDHMKFLKHQRDKTMREGIRTTQHSLNECISCHASQKTGSVIGSNENFCQSCHAYAAVKLDCFECHQANPKSFTPAAAAGTGTSKP